MLSNLYRMPRPMGFSSVLATFNCAFTLSTLVRDVIALPHKTISQHEWWANGSGFILLFPGLLLGISTILLLKRLRYGRAVQIIGWLLSVLSTYPLVRINGIPMRPELELVGVTALVGVVGAYGLYLYVDKRVAAYFNGR